MKKKRIRVSDEMALAIVRGFHLEGRSQSEMAEEFNISQTTVHLHVHGTVKPHIYAKVAEEEQKMGVSEDSVLKSNAPVADRPHGPAPEEPEAVFGRQRTDEEVMADWEEGL